MDVLTPTGPFYVYPLSDSWAVGASLTVPFAGTLDYDQDWVGRNIVTEVEFTTFNLRPSIAYRVNDRLSVGASFIVSYAIFEQKIALETPAPGDGSVEIEKADDWEVGVALGVMLEPWDGTRIGLGWTSELEHDLSGDLKLDTPMLPAFTFGLETVLVLPQAAFVSLRQELGQQLTVYVDYAWADFSAFDVTQIDLSTGASVQLPRNWRDVVAYGVGLQYEVFPGWTLQGGLSYASSPTRNRDRTPDLPLDRQVRYGAGLIYDWSESFQIAFSYEYLDLGDAKVAKTIGGGTLSGEYDSNRAQFFALSFIKSF